jgi:hypothetical protein
MKVYGEVVVELHSFLTSSLSEGQWSASCRSCLTIREGEADTRLTGDLCGLRAGIRIM